MPEPFSVTAWRDTQLEPRFFFLNWRVLWLLVPLVLIPETNTRIPASILILVLMIFLRLAENRGLSFNRAWRALRASVAGRKRYARAPQRNRRNFNEHDTPDRHRKRQQRRKA